MAIVVLVEQMMIHAINRGWSDQSTVSLFRLQEESAGIQVRSHRLHRSRNHTRSFLQDATPDLTRKPKDTGQDWIEAQA